MEARYRIHPGVAWRIVDDVVFLLTPDSRYRQIDDPVGILVWGDLAALPAGTSVSMEALVDRICSEFDVARTTAKADLEEFLGALATGGALERESLSGNK